MKKNKKRWILRIGVIVLAGVVLGIQLYSWNASSLGGDKMPMPLGFATSVVLSGSMEPELSVDDMIIVVSRESYEVGDVVVFQSYGTLIVHRIISIDGETVVTQGDANPTPDAPIKLKDIKGEVVYSIPYVGLVLSFIRSPIGVILILGSAFFLMERSFRKEKEESMEELDLIKEEIRRLQAQQTKSESLQEPDTNHTEES